MILAIKTGKADAGLSGAEPPPGAGLPAQALWWDAKGEWDKAHGCAQADESRDGAAVLGRIGNSDTFVLVDPDLVNNRAMVDERNARAALAMLRAIDPDAMPVQGTALADALRPPPVRRCCSRRSRPSAA